MDSGVICELPTESPSHFVVTRANGLHEEVKVENVPAAKTVQTRRQLSHSSGHAVIKPDLK